MTEKEFDKPLVAALRGVTQKQVPFWLMRQAGRYLPEYRALAEKAGGFLDLVFNPDRRRRRRCSRQALQHRRGILFSDILVVPKALGQDVAFREGEGPVLRPVRIRRRFRLLNLRNFDTVSGAGSGDDKKTRGLLKSEGFNIRR